MGSSRRSAPGDTRPFGIELIDEEGVRQMEVTKYYEHGPHRRWPYMIGAAVLAGIIAFAVYEGVAASPDAAAVAENESATVEPIGKTGLNRLVLTPSAIKRLDVKTAPVHNIEVKGERRTVVPYGAVFYDADGQTWVYTSPKPRTFVRASITIDSIDGSGAILSAGPAAGTRVATVGVQELFGSETEYSG